MQRRIRRRGEVKEKRICMEAKILIFSMRDGFLNISANISLPAGTLWCMGVISELLGSAYTWDWKDYCMLYRFRIVYVPVSFRQRRWLFKLFCVGVSPVTSREEYRLWMPVNKMQRRIFGPMTEGVKEWRTWLNNGELHNLYPSHRNIKAINII